VSRLFQSQRDHRRQRYPLGRPCDRCGDRPFYARFIAGDRPALKFRGGEFRLCKTCVDSLGDFLGRGVGARRASAVSSQVQTRTVIDGQEVNPPWVAC
jgi:hypothetical protein